MCEQCCQCCEAQSGAKNHALFLKRIPLWRKSFFKLNHSSDWSLFLLFSLESQTGTKFYKFVFTWICVFIQHHEDFSQGLCLQTQVNELGQHSSVCGFTGFLSGQTWKDNTWESTSSVDLNLSHPRGEETRTNLSMACLYETHKSCVFYTKMPDCPDHTNVLQPDKAKFVLSCLQFPNTEIAENLTNDHAHVVTVLCPLGNQP